MKIIVFSDVHGNLESLRRVVEEFRAIEPDLVVSLGDVVGYGAQPAECIELVWKTADILISGNHDYAAAGLTPTDNFNPVARNSIKWTADALNQRQINFLKSFQPLVHRRDCLFTHSSPLSPLEWPYITTLAQSREILEKTEEKFIFIGHTHIPALISFDSHGQIEYLLNSPVRIEPGFRYLINAGSVGQPRDGINAACFTLLDTDSGFIEQKRVEYDFRATQREILHAGLPERLASRLESGE
ncbi:MAG: metallophosphoesterase family protein [Candidatus Krumholzibacteriales bacterium]